METTIRIQKTDGTWLELACAVDEQTGTSARVRIPDPKWRAEWLIGIGGMVGNVGGNDWRIYTVHPDDCRRLCAVPGR